MPTFLVKNTVRSPHTRTLRAAAPIHHRLKQYVGKKQARLVRGRGVVFQEAELMENLVELLHKQKQGILTVHTMDGRVVDLRTLEATKSIEVATLPAVLESPAPQPRLDSAAFDKPAGEKMPMFPGGQTVTDLPPEEEEGEDVEVSMEELKQEEVPDMTAEIPAQFLPAIEVDQDGQEGRRGKGKKNR